MKVLLLCTMNTSRAQKAALNRKHLEWSSCEWLLSADPREEDKGIFLSKCSFSKLVQQLVILLQVGPQSVPAAGSLGEGEVRNDPWSILWLCSPSVQKLFSPWLSPSCLCFLVSFFSLFFLLSLVLLFSGSAVLTTPVTNRWEEGAAVGDGRERRQEMMLRRGSIMAVWETSSNRKNNMNTESSISSLQKALLGFPANTGAFLLPISFVSLCVSCKEIPFCNSLCQLLSNAFLRFHWHRSRKRKY